MSDETGAPDEPRTSRRRFLDVMIGGCAGLGALVGAGTVFSYLSPPHEKMQGSGEPQEVAAEEDIRVNEGRVVAYGSDKVLIVHAESGFLALSAVCTHAGCLVVWDGASKRVHCPCHDGFFDLKGNVLGGPPPSPLKSYRAEVVDGKVMVGGA